MSDESFNKVSDLVEDCGHCDGTGREYVPGLSCEMDCSVCKGSGKIIEPGLLISVSNSLKNAHEQYSGLDLSDADDRARVAKVVLIELNDYLAADDALDNLIQLAETTTQIAIENGFDPLTALQRNPVYVEEPDEDESDEDREDRE